MAFGRADPPGHVAHQGPAAPPGTAQHGPGDHRSHPVAHPMPEGAPHALGPLGCAPAAKLSATFVGGTLDTKHPDGRSADKETLDEQNLEATKVDIKMNSKDMKNSNGDNAEQKSSDDNNGLQYQGIDFTSRLNQSSIEHIDAP